MGNPPYDPNYGQQQQYYQQQPPAQQYYQPPPPPPPEKSHAGLIVAIVAVVVVVIVVLAAVLYVMVIGFSSSGTYTSAPVGYVSSTDALSSTSARITFGTFSPTPEPMDIRIIITDNYGYSYETYTLSFLSQPYSSTTTMYATNGATATYTDLNYAGNAINAGDYITVYGLESGTTYSVEIFHIPSDTICTVAGDTTFTTP